MHWMPLTIFLAVMLCGYLLADKLDKLDEIRVPKRRGEHVALLRAPKSRPA